MPGPRPRVSHKDCLHKSISSWNYFSVVHQTSHSSHREPIRSVDSLVVSRNWKSMAEAMIFDQTTGVMLLMALTSVCLPDRSFFSYHLCLSVMFPSPFSHILDPHSHSYYLPGRHIHDTQTVCL